MTLDYLLALVTALTKIKIVSVGDNKDVFEGSCQNFRATADADTKSYLHNEIWNIEVVDNVLVVQVE